MYRKGFILFYIFFVFNTAIAQYPVISHMDWLHWQNNPAFVGVNQQENLMLDYNRSWISKEVNSNIATLQYDRAFVTSNNRNIGGIGASIMNNRVNYREIYNRFQATLGAAYAFRIRRDLYLNFGLQGNYNADNVNNSGLLTGSQYVPGWGFDPGLGSNEPTSILKVDYFGISTGMFLYQSSEDVLPDNYLGFSVKNLNRPVNSFYDESSSLSPQFNLMGGSKLLEGPRNKLSGELWYAHSNGKGNLTLGAIYQMNNLISQRSSEDNIALRLVSRYAVNNKFLVGGQLLYDGFTVGFTYDIPVPGITERTFDSGFEVLLVLHRKAKPFKRRDRTKKKSKYQPTAKVIPEPEPIVAKDTLVTEQVIAEPSVEESQDTTSNISGNARTGLLIDDKPLEGKVYFDFASKEISEASETFLQEFISEFYLRGKSMIFITGHTDNVGSNSYNQQLSLSRAASVRQKLISFGIDESQITIRGMGEEAPLVPNNSPENRAKNRRVEISFY